MEICSVVIVNSGWWPLFVTIATNPGLLFSPLLHCCDCVLCRSSPGRRKQPKQRSTSTLRTSTSSSILWVIVYFWQITVLKSGHVTMVVEQIACRFLRKSYITWPSAKWTPRITCNRAVDELSSLTWLHNLRIIFWRVPYHLSTYSPSLLSIDILTPVSPSL